MQSILRLTVRPALIRTTLSKIGSQMENSTIANRMVPTAASGTNRGRGGRGGRGSRPARGRGRGRGFATTAQRTNANETPALSSNDVTPRESGASSPVFGGQAGYLSEAKFSDLKGKVDSRLLSAIPFANMSPVQAATIHTALQGKDILAQAKTGTGKTLAFLVPAIQALCAMPNPPHPSSVSVLVLSPTRELAMQIEKEAQMLLANLQGIIGVQHSVGGTNINAERKRLISGRKDILVATPGRVIDYLENTDGSALDLKRDCRNLRVLVLDEADRMLDMGFRRDLEKILKVLPDPITSGRQSMFFSATIPSFVHETSALRRDHAFISTLTEEDVNTHEHVPQESLVCPGEEVLPRTVQVAAAEAARLPNNHKILVFLPTARSTGLAAAVFADLREKQASTYGKIGPVFEIHSRKSQTHRTKAMAEFRQSPSGILFSSDVTARGVDVPGISLVIQAGVPSSIDQYVHRLGRTARAGKDGRGVLILGDFEKFFLRQADFSKLPVSPIDVNKLDQECKLDLATVQDAVGKVMVNVDAQTRAQAYQAHLGFYKNSIKAMGWNIDNLIAASNEYARKVLLWPSPAGGAWLPPPLLKKTVGMMGLKGKSGLNVVSDLGKTSSDTGRGVNGGGARIPTNGPVHGKNQMNGQGGRFGPAKKQRS